MKKSIIISILGLLMVSAANAQEFKKFRVGIGTGYAIPSGSGSKGGVLLYVEPGYRITDQLLVNLRMEIAVMARGTAEDLSTAETIDVSASGSYTANGQYYLKPSGFRPFVGAGLGIYSIAAAAVTADEASVGGSQAKFGFYPRVGFDAGHFQLSIDYNIVGKTTVEDILNGGNTEFKNNYIGIRIGAYIGGGKKK